MKSIIQWLDLWRKTWQSKLGERMCVCSFKRCFFYKEFIRYFFYKEAFKGTLQWAGEIGIRLKRIVIWEAKEWAIEILGARESIPGSGNSQCKALRHSKPDVFEDLQDCCLFIVLTIYLQYFIWMQNVKLKNSMVFYNSQLTWALLSLWLP